MGHLDCSSCNNLTNAGLQSLAERLPAQLQDLSVHFDNCVSIGDEGVKALSQSMPKSVRAFKGTFIGTEVGRVGNEVDRARASPSLQGDTAFLCLRDLQDHCAG